MPKIICRCIDKKLLICSSFNIFTGVETILDLTKCSDSSLLLAKNIVERKVPLKKTDYTIDDVIDNLVRNCSWSIECDTGCETENDDTLKLDDELNISGISSICS